MLTKIIDRFLNRRDPNHEKMLEEFKKIAQRVEKPKKRLSEKDVRRIRVLAQKEPLTKIAQRFQVSTANVSLIVNRKTWKDL